MSIFKRSIDKLLAEIKAEREAPETFVTPTKVTVENGIVTAPGEWVDKIRFGGRRLVMMGYGISMKTELTNEKGQLITIADGLFRTDEEAIEFFEAAIEIVKSKGAKD